MNDDQFASPSEFGRIDAACNRFEAQLRAGENPCIEDFLADSSAPERRRLFRALLEIETELQPLESALSSPNEWTARFPEYTDLIRDVCGAAASDDESLIEVFPVDESDTVSHVDAASTPTFISEIRQPAESNPQVGQRIGEYELLQELGRGGMGVVYRARHVALDREVALKTIRSGRLADAEEIERFHIEAKAAAALHHPNIVQIYEIGQQGELHYFTMRLVAGESLADRLISNPLPPRDAADILKSIARGIHFAHEHGIVHRDLKPANILLENTGVPQITDFGLAKNLAGDSGMTVTGQIMGTPSYMPPEQATGNTEAVGPLSDVYSLGAILYATLAGRPPFQAAAALDVLKQVVEQEPVSLRQLNSQIDRDLETICHKCLEKDPEKRYATAGDLADDLGRYLNHEPISARPISRPQRMVRWCRRNPLLTTFIASLLLGLAAVSYLAKEMRGARDVAESRLTTISQQTSQLAEQADVLRGTIRKLETNQSELQRTIVEKDQQVAEKLLKSGSVECEAGRIDNGLLYFIRALEVLPPEKDQLAFAIRTNFDLWRKQLNVLQWQRPSLSPRFATPNFWRLSPDGTKFVTVHHDVRSSRVIIRDTGSGRPIGQPMNHPNRIVDVAFAAADGSLITIDGGTQPRKRNQVFGSKAIPKRNAAIRRWDLRTGKIIGKPIVFEAPVVRGAFAPGGSYAVLKFDGTGDKELGQVWSMTPLRRLHRLEIEDKVRSASFVFSQDSRYLASFYVPAVPARPFFSRQRVWSVETGTVSNDPQTAEILESSITITGARHAQVPIRQLRESMQRLPGFARDGGPRAIAVSSDVDRVATIRFSTLQQFEITVWKLPSRTAIGQRLAGGSLALFHSESDLCVIYYNKRIWGWYLAGSVPDDIMRIDRTGAASLQRLKLWTEVATGKALSKTDEVYFLELADWESRARQIRGPKFDRSNRNR